MGSAAKRDRPVSGIGRQITTLARPPPRKDHRAPDGPGAGKSERAGRGRAGTGTGEDGASNTWRGRWHTKHTLLSDSRMPGGTDDTKQQEAFSSLAQTGCGLWGAAPNHISRQLTAWARAAPSCLERSSPNPSMMMLKRT